MTRLETRSKAARKAWTTRRSPTYKASRSERESKKALASWCRANGWKVLFFEGESGAPRTGIVDAIMARIKPKDFDAIDILFSRRISGRTVKINHRKPAALREVI
jgi:hypothetical protein